MGVFSTKMEVINRSFDKSDFRVELIKYRFVIEVTENPNKFSPSLAQSR